MPATPKLSSFTVKVGNELFDVGGGYFQFDFTVQAGTVGEILQNIANTFFTRYGTQRLQRTFGLDMSWIDQPGNFATLQAQVAVLRDCSYWEPRATFKNITFQLDSTSMLAGVYRLYVELVVNLDLQIAQSLFVPLGTRDVWFIDSPMDGTPNAATVKYEAVA